MPALVHEPALAPDFTLFNADHSLGPPSPSLADAVAYALQKCPGFKFLPSNYDSLDSLPPNASPATAHFSCDDFRMYEFKVRRCMRGRSHDWTECPFAHPGEKARRRDPRRIHYSGSPCPDFRKGSCRRGDACEFAHGVFECWLHPARYRTQVCKDGKNCKRRVCFFAHSPEQLRILPLSMASAPTSTPSPMEKVDAYKSSTERLSSQEVLLSSSVSMSRGLQFNSSSAMSSPPSSAHSPVQVSPISMHLESSNGSALRRAMVQNLLACKGYGVNPSAAEYPLGSDICEGLSEARMAHASNLNIQSPRVGERTREVSISTQQPFLKHLGSNFPCASKKQALWGSSTDFASAGSGGVLDLLQGGDASAYEQLGANKIGDESSSFDNSMPDFGWVSELVK